MKCALARLCMTLAAIGCSGGSHSSARGASAARVPKGGTTATEPPAATSRGLDAGFPVPSSVPDAAVADVVVPAQDAGAGGPSAMPDSGRAPHPTSKYCGDAIRDPVLEECDDGPGGGDDGCSPDCRVRATPLLDPIETQPPDADGGPGTEPDSARSLGTGPHVASGLELGFAAVFVEGMLNPAVRLQAFAESGGRLGTSIDVGADSAATVAANPVVAALSDTRYAVAWTDGGGGTPDVLMRVVDVSDDSLGARQSPHESTAGFQQDPDLLWTGSELIVAWTDLLDVKYRRFDAELQPIDAERYLGGSDAIESNVTLAPFAGGWAAALRANRNGLEQIEVTAGDLKWSTPPSEPGPSGDRAALAALDESHLLLVFSAGTDPSGSGTPNVGQLRVAVLDTASPGMVDAQPFGPLDAPLAGDTSLPQRRPSAVRVQDHVYVGWENASGHGAQPATQVLIARMELSANGSTLMQSEELRLPLALAHVGDQQNLRLGGSQLFPDGALITVWEQPFGGALLGADLMLDFRPSPFVMLPALATM